MSQKSNIELFQSPEAEAALLGAIIIDPAQIDLIDLRADEFYIQRYRWVYEALREMRTQGISIDIQTVVDQLDQENRLKAIGGAAALASLVNASPYATNAPEYARTIRAKARRRRLFQLGGDIARAAMQPETDLDQAIAGFYERLVNNAQPEQGAQPIGTHISALYDDVEKRAANPSDIWGISSGFPDWDNLTGGFHPGESFLLAGEPGIGKSILALQLASNLAATAPGAVYSLEMSGLAVTRRMLSAQARYPTRNLKTGRIGDNDWPVIAAAFSEIEKLPIYLYAGAQMTTSGLRADLARLKAVSGIRWFVLDYLYLIDSPVEDEIERTAAVSKDIKAICKDLDLAGLSVHSITKEGMGRRPSMRTLRGSGQLIFDADVIAFIAYSDNQDEQNVRHIIFEKGREMEALGRIKLIKQATYPAFGSLAPEPKL